MGIRMERKTGSGRKHGEAEKTIRNLVWREQSAQDGMTGKIARKLGPLGDPKFYYIFNRKSLEPHFSTNNLAMDIQNRFRWVESRSKETC